MGDYTVELEGHTFTAEPAIDWSAERVHRLDSVPEVHVATLYTITLRRCRVYSSDGTSDKAQEAFGTFLANCLHKRVKPTYLKILDASSAAIDEIGNINTAAVISGSQWEEILVTGLEIDDGAAQFRAGVEFSLTIQAKRVFFDSNNLVLLRREYRSDVGPDGLETRTLQSRVEMKAGTAVPTSASWLLTLVRLAAPAGWVSQVGSSRIVVSYPEYGRTDVAEILSQVKRLGGGVVAPSGAGGASVVESRRDLPDLGLVEVTKQVEAVGASDPDGWLDGQQPDGSVGERSEETGNTLQARGSWTTLEPAGKYIGGKVTRLQVSRYFKPGGRVVKVSRLTGNFEPIVRRGAIREWRLVEVVRAVALAPKTLAEFPTLPLLDGELWLFDPEASGIEPPKMIENRGTSTQHLWERVSTREYVWLGGGNPLDNESVRSLLVKRYEAGEEGLVLAQESLP